MPVYCYKCKDCKTEFEIRHSMSFEGQSCTACNSDNVFKIPSLNLHKITTEAASKVGKVVDDYIRDVKQEIKEEKHRLKTEEL